MAAGCRKYEGQVWLKEAPQRWWHVAKTCRCSCLEEEYVGNCRDPEARTEQVFPRISKEAQWLGRGGGACMAGDAVSKVMTGSEAAWQDLEDR